MRWPSKADHKRIADCWAIAGNSASSASEKNAAKAVLEGLQRDYELSNAALAYFAEAHHHRRGEVNAFDVTLDTILRCRVIISLEQAILATLWGLHTYVYDHFLHTPRLSVQSFEPECGKTAFGMLMSALTFNPLFTGSTSPAAVYYRLKESPRSTLIIDEVENSSLWAADRLLLNVFDNGHRKGGGVTRVAGGKVVCFPAFAPLMLIGIWDRPLARQLVSRSIPFWMERRPEGIDEIDPEDPGFVPIRIVNSQWANTFRRPESCELPRELVGRSADNWRPLIAIADTLGYPATARAIARALHQPTIDPADTALWDVCRVFETCTIGGYATNGLNLPTGLWTEDILASLLELPDARWDEYGLDDGGRPRKLGRADLLMLLRRRHVRTRDVWRRVDGKRISRKGFYWSEIERARQRIFGDTPTQSSKIIALP